MGTDHQKSETIAQRAKSLQAKEKEFNTPKGISNAQVVEHFQKQLRGFSTAGNLSMSAGAIRVINEYKSKS